MSPSSRQLHLANFISPTMDQAHIDQHIVIKPQLGRDAQIVVRQARAGQ
ncbi:MAG: hypothetical protein ABSG23_03690 [Terriglobales bacterium]